MTQGFDPSRAGRDAAARAAENARAQALRDHETSVRLGELSRRRRAGPAKGRRPRHRFFRFIGFLLWLAVFAIVAAVIIAVVSGHGLHR